MHRVELRIDLEHFGCQGHALSIEDILSPSSYDLRQNVVSSSHKEERPASGCEGSEEGRGIMERGTRYRYETRSG